MLPAAVRMRESSQFSTTWRFGARAGTATVTVALRGGRAAGPMVGFVVSRSVGPAVVRNRTRRQLRHAVRELLADLPADACVVIRAAPAAAGAPFALLAADVRSALQRAARRWDDRAAAVPR